MQRLDQINAFKPANLFDFKSLALKFGKNRLAGLKQSHDRDLDFTMQNRPEKLLLFSITPRRAGELAMER